MTNPSTDGTEIPNGNGFIELFPGFYPPSREERLDTYRNGLVTLDANAMLDLYRFSSNARSEFFQILEKVQPRLFITHQAALEFHRNRLAVVESRLRAADDKCEEIKEPLRSVINKIDEFANRYQIGSAEQTRLIKLVQELEDSLADAIKAAGTYDLTSEEVRAGSDAVVAQLQLLTHGKVGNPLSDEEKMNAVKEAERRREHHVPPGYAEKKATAELRAGDYILWKQLMREASAHGRSVLLVSNEKKEDWVYLGPSNKILGPRPELVLEMRNQASVALHTVTVVGLLKEAPDFLGVQISSSTIREAEAIPDKPDTKVRLSLRARREFTSLADAEKQALAQLLNEVKIRIESGREIEDTERVLRSTRRGNIYLLRWSDIGRAIIEIAEEADQPFPIIVILEINRKKDPGESSSKAALESSP